MIIYPCKIRKKEVSIYDKGICFDHCNNWVYPHAMLSVMWTINLYKVKMNLGTKFLVLKKFFLFVT